MNTDYNQKYRNFDAKQVASEIFGENLSQLNAADLCCDQHCGKNKVALRWRSERGDAVEYTFEELKIYSERLASVLSELGVGPGDRVAGLLPRIPELVMTVLATWRLGGVYQPLFTAFGPKAIDHRVSTSKAKVIVTDLANRSKLDNLGQSVTTITVAKPGDQVPAEDISFHEALDAAGSRAPLIIRDVNDPFLMMFTSGTTGPAKPLYVPINALISFAVYMREAIDLKDTENFWNIADPGWAYGLYYAVTGPLLLGCATLLYDGAFSVESAVNTIRQNNISNLAGAPTAFRLMIGEGPEALREIKGQLRAVSSAGEPLNAEVIRWFADHLDTVINDHYGQTELGMVLCNHHGLKHEVTPGAAGYAMPGFRLAIVNDEGVELPAGEEGNLAVDIKQSPLFWFAGYEGMPTKALGEHYYITGDSAVMNSNGSIKFVSRADDVITSSGYRIGPFDVESVLLEHEAVVEVAVIGKPDPVRTEVVKAFVIAGKQFEPSETLTEELQKLVKHRLGAHAYPREIEFIDELPKTPSGKIQRFMLRQRS